MPVWILSAFGLAKRFWPVLAILAVVAILSLAYCEGKGAGEAQRDNQTLRGNEKTLQNTMKADGAAADARLTDQARQQQEQAELQRVTNNAPDPNARRLAFHRCLRDQQAARAAGRPAPACS